VIDAENMQPNAESYEAASTIERPKLRSGRTLRRDVVETIVLIAIVYTLVNLSTVRAIVYGPSMEPNFYTGQLVIVNRFAYYFSGPARGDVVVLHNPLKECRNAPPDDKSCELLIKRVVGLPGEMVRIKGGRVYINGTMLNEPYVTEFCPGCDIDGWTLNPAEYFVLGDNRKNSWDGHSFGPIPRSLIEGQAWIRYWPPKDATIIPHPSYGTIAAQSPVAAPTPTGTSN
jgi:signal peptidase I